jgi:hypothetical protein
MRGNGPLIIGVVSSVTMTAACSSRSLVPGPVDIAGIAVMDASSPNGGGGPAVDMASGGAGNEVAGSVGGVPFGGGVRGWFVGHADSPTTNVVYLFNREVECDDSLSTLKTKGWDAKLPAGVQFLELIVAGPTPPVSPPTPAGLYTVVPATMISAGYASVTHATTMGGSATNESAASGSVVVRGINATRIVGTFNAMFSIPPGGALTGSFDVSMCAAAVQR